MRIGLLPLAAGRKAGGPETYEVELIRSLAAVDQRNEYFIYCTCSAAEEAIGIRQDNFTFRRLSPSNRYIALTTALPIRLIRDRVDLLHCTYAPPPVSPTPYVFTLHCTSNLEHPEYYAKSKVFRLNALQQIGLKRARYIFCVSEFIRNYLIHERSIPAQKMGVVYNGVAQEFRPVPASERVEQLRVRFGIDYPYFLYVGKLQARKNLVRLIHAFARYRQKLGSPVRLVLAGPKTETSEGIDEAVKSLGMEESVVRLGYVEPPTAGGCDDLPLLYSGCRVFVFPSLYEGFGIPLVEAMACEAPVITSSATCLPEVAGDAALIVNPLSVEAIADALVQLDTDEELRRGVIERGRRRAREFSWERCARETLAGYTLGAAS